MLRQAIKTPVAILGMLIFLAYVNDGALPDRECWALYTSKDFDTQKIAMRAWCVSMQMTALRAAVDAARLNVRFCQFSIALNVRNSLVVGPNLRRLD